MTLHEYYLHNKEILANDRILAELVRRLVEAFQPERIFLFGSKARGETGPDSDYDLLVLVGDEAPPERLRSRKAYQALRGTRTAADVLVWSQEEFERRLHVIASLPATIDGTVKSQNNGDFPKSPLIKSAT